MKITELDCDKNRRVTWAAAAFLVAAIGAGIARAEEPENWQRFRGPNGAGVSHAAGIPTEWTEDDYNWKVKLPGIGHSSPVVWGERIFVGCGEEETGDRIMLCLDAASGEVLWQQQFKATTHRKHKLNSFASSTPAVDANRVYWCWATPESFIVVAVNHTGKESGRVALGPFKAGHGGGVSPIVHQDLLIVPKEHGGESALFALEKATGATRWSIPRETKTTYSTPCVLELPGRKPELIFTNWKHGITAVEPQSGKRNWEIDVFDKGHVETAIGSPVISGDMVWGVCGWLGYGYQTVGVRLEFADGKPNPREVYRITRSAPLCTTPLVVDDLLFLWADQGIVTCAEAATGKVHWRQRVGGNYYSSPISVGNRIYNVATDGEVVVLAASPEFRVLGRSQLGEGSHSTPAVAGGRMYLRTFSSLISLGAAEAGAK